MSNYYNYDGRRYRRVPKAGWSAFGSNRRRIFSSEQPKFTDCQEYHILCMSRSVADTIIDLYGDRENRVFGRKIVSKMETLKQDPFKDSHPVPTIHQNNLYEHNFTCKTTASTMYVTMLFELEEMKAKHGFDHSTWKICVSNLGYTP